jgi:hypothetical protein
MPPHAASPVLPPAQCVNRWLSVRLELLGISVVFGMAVFVAVALPRSAGLAGLALTSGARAACRRCRLPRVMLRAACAAFARRRPVCLLTRSRLTAPICLQRSTSLAS